MAVGSKGAETGPADPRLELSHQRRDARTALELAVVALAPWSVIERLATAAGLLEALSELPPDSPPALTLMPKVIGLAKEALDQWRNWEKEHLQRRLPRG
jgi:hypothetical protein